MSYRLDFAIRSRAAARSHSESFICSPAAASRMALSSSAVTRKLIRVSTTTLAVFVALFFFAAMWASYADSPRFRNSASPDEGTGTPRKFYVAQSVAPAPAAIASPHSVYVYSTHWRAASMATIEAAVPAVACGPGCDPFGSCPCADEQAALAAAEDARYPQDSSRLGEAWNGAPGPIYAYPDPRTIGQIDHAEAIC